MNLTHAPSYVLEEVNPARMEFVNSLAIEDVNRGTIRDNRRELHFFRCLDCERFVTAIDRDVGYTQAIIRCPWCVSFAGPARRQRRPLKGEETIHVEFYRPLSEAEVDEFILTTITTAKAVTLALGGDPSDEENPARVAVQNAAATRLLNGLLIPRDLVNTEGG